jgi:hypothetical protein
MHAVFWLASLVSPRRFVAIPVGIDWWLSPALVAAPSWRVHFDSARESAGNFPGQTRPGLNELPMNPVLKISASHWKP